MKQISIVALVVALLASAGGTAAAQNVPSGMARIAAGEYRPLRTADGRTVRVNAFAIDTVMVSRASFAEFVRRHPRWAKGNVSKSLADSDYLKDFHTANPGRRPATWVSWHAAQAYCQARGARLPTTAEWEYLARANERERERAAADEPAFRQRTLELALSARPSAFLIGSGLRNVWGVRDLHGGPFEWTQDFAGPATGHHPHLHKEGATCGSGAVDSGDASDYAAFLRAAFRTAATTQTTAGNIGFRCAATL
jgi:formylglycine-generating enzyme required for sulfatase activity